MNTSRFAFALLALSLLVPPVLAEGTVTQSVTVVKDAVGIERFKTVTFEWVGDSSSGSVPSTELTAANAALLKGWYLYLVETDPGRAPTALYDIVLNSSSGVDLMGGSLANRSATSTEIAYPLYASVPIDGTITLVISNQAVAGATGTVKLYLGRDPAPGVAGNASASSTVSTATAQVTLTGAGVLTATDTSNMAVMAAAAAGITNQLLYLTITNSSSTDAFAYVCDGSCASAGNRKLIVPVPAGQGIPIFFPISAPFASSAATAINVAAVSGVTTMSASALGFTK